MERLRARLLLALVAASGAACGTDEPDAPPSTITNASDVPLDGLSAGDVAKFRDGDDLFDLPFRPADGLGPLYIRTACGACHAEGSRGPGLVQKMAIVEADGVTPTADQSALPFGHTLRPGLAAGATTPIAPPDLPDVLVSIRLGPAVLGRGYLEAIDDAEILRVEAEQAARSDGIHGHANRVRYASQPNPDTTFFAYQPGDMLLGRFGVKARNATLDDFTADAFQGDMGLTTPMRPTELPNPDGLTDDLRPGTDLTQAHIDRIAFYLRRIAIPKRLDHTTRGAALFESTGCATCHAPTLHTRADYPIAQLADLDAPVYTDLLLHDMGDALADGMTDESASSRTWRTAPLIGLRFTQIYLHDGRAHSIAEAIDAHAGEAAPAAAAFRALPATDQDTLTAFVAGL